MCSAPTRCMSKGALPSNSMSDATFPHPIPLMRVNTSQNFAWEKWKEKERELLLGGSQMGQVEEVWHGET